ncbi:MAG TPA: hypothetical protein VFC47_01995 [Caulobacteraceae bacterium]|nr:hypothetical protein [Caulobacteraceae bacterium]
MSETPKAEPDTPKAEPDTPERQARQWARLREFYDGISFMDGRTLADIPIAPADDDEGND